MASSALGLRDVIQNGVRLNPEEVLSGGEEREIEFCCFVDSFVPSGPEDIKLFSGSSQLSMKFSQLINMKMPTIVGIFIFISRQMLVLSYIYLHHENMPI